MIPAAADQVSVITGASTVAVPLAVALTVAVNAGVTATNRVPRGGRPTRKGQSQARQVGKLAFCLVAAMDGHMEGA